MTIDTRILENIFQNPFEKCIPNQFWILHFETFESPGIFGKHFPK
jgi:hypothetical protein